MWVPPEIRDPVLMHPHPQICRLLRLRSVPGTGKFIRTMCRVRRGYVRNLLKNLRYRSRGKAHGCRPGQRQVPPRHTSQALASEISHRCSVCCFYRHYSPGWLLSSGYGSWLAAYGTHNRFFATLNELLAAVDICFDRWRQPSCSCCVDYANLRPRYVWDYPNAVQAAGQMAV